MCVVPGEISPVATIDSVSSSAFATSPLLPPHLSWNNVVRLDAALRASDDGAAARMIAAEERAAAEQAAADAAVVLERARLTQVAAEAAERLLNERARIAAGEAAVRRAPPAQSRTCCSLNSTPTTGSKWHSS